MLLWRPLNQRAAISSSITTGKDQYLGRDVVVPVCRKGRTSYLRKCTTENQSFCMVSPSWLLKLECCRYFARPETRGEAV